MALGLALAWKAIAFASYNTPGEDDFPWFWMFFTFVLTVPYVGLGLLGSRGALDVLLLVVGYVAALSPPAAYWMASGLPAGSLLLLAALLTVVLIVAAAPSLAMWVLGRLCHFDAFAYRTAIAILPTLAVISTFGFPELDMVKWTRPWTDLQPQLVAFQQEAISVVRELGLPTKRWTADQRAMFERRFQARREFVTPTGHWFAARVIQFEDPEGEIYLYWGGAFGRVDIRSLTIRSASD